MPKITLLVQDSDRDFFGSKVQIVTMIMHYNVKKSDERFQGLGYLRGYF